MSFDFITHIESCYIAINALEEQINLLYYSHIPTSLIALVLASYVFWKNREELSSKLFLSIAILFSIWSFFDLILWTSSDSRRTMFFWSFINIIENFITCTTLYFTYVFLEKRDAKLRYKIAVGLLLIFFLFLIPTTLNLTGFNAPNCEAEQGTLIYYFYFLEILFFSWTLIYLVKKIIYCEKKARKKTAFFALGAIFFLASFSGANVIGSITGYWEILQYGLFGMPIFMAFLVYLIVKYQAFNIKLFGAQALIAALILLIASQYFFIQNNTNKILTGITLTLAIIFGRWLIQSILDEIHQKEELLDMTDKLSQAYSKMKQLDRAKSEFVSIASHQLRTPLTAIKGFNSLLLEGSYGKLTKKVREVVEKVYLSNERLINLVEDLLNISRIESGKFVFNFKENDIVHLVADVSESMQFAAKNKFLYIDFTPPKHPIKTFVFDKDKIREVVNNLMDNAIKYTKKGGVTVRIRVYRDGEQTYQLGQKDVSVSADKKNVKLSGSPHPEGYNLVQIVISDTGIGIEPGEEKYIFEKFQRGKDIGKIHTEGVGLGLYVAQKIIEAHEGMIWAESDGLGKGSRFYVQLKTDFVPPAPGTASDLSEKAV